MKKLIYIFLPVFILIFSDAIAEPELVVSQEKNTGGMFESIPEYLNTTYHYLNVTEKYGQDETIVTNGAYNLLFKKLEDTDYLDYKVEVVAASGRVYKDETDIQSMDQSIPGGKSFDITFRPAIDETGICRVLLYSKNKTETEYKLIDSFPGQRLVPQHMIRKDMPVSADGYDNPYEYDYTIYFADDFFTNINKITPANYIELMEEAFVDMWKKMIVDWQLCKGVDVTYDNGTQVINRPADINRNIELIIYDGERPYHSLESVNSFDGSTFTFANTKEKAIYMPADIIESDGIKAQYFDADDAVYTAVAYNLFNLIQQSLNPAGVADENWIYNGAALAMQSIATQPQYAEFKRTSTEYARAVQAYLADTDVAPVPNENESKEIFAMYWRFLFENIIPEGSQAERAEIFRTASKYAATGDFYDIESYMNQALRDIPKSKYRTFHHSWTAFAEKMLYLIDGTHHWGRWYDNNIKIYSEPNYEKSYYFDFTDNYAGYVKSSISNSYGINFHKFDNGEFFRAMATKNLDFEFLGDGYADWAVVVEIEKTDNYHGSINSEDTKDSKAIMQGIEGSSAVTYVLPIEKFKNKKRAKFSLRSAFADYQDLLFSVEEVKIAVVRLDRNGDEAEYSITWNDNEDMTLYVVEPSHENPEILQIEDESTLDIRFTVVDADENFVDFLRTERLSLVTENGRIKYNLNIENVEIEDASYLITADLPTSLPAGIYSLELSAQDPTNLDRYITGHALYSLLIHNDYGCAGQELELSASYKTGIAPVIKFALQAGEKPEDILDATYPSGEQIDIEFIVTDDEDVVDARVYFRRAGESRYFYYAMEKKPGSDSIYIASLKDSVAVSPGCDFFIRAVDNDGRVSTLPFDREPEEYPFKLAIGNSESGVISEKPSVQVLNNPALTLLSYDNPIDFEVEVIDTNSYIEEVGMYYRIEGELFWHRTSTQLNPVAEKTIVNFQIPAGFSGMKPIEYSVYAVDNHGLIGYYGSKNYPKYLDFQVPAPKLLMPANGDTVVAYDTEYLWEDLEDVYQDMAYFYDYYMEVSKSPGFEEDSIVAIEMTDNPYAVLENLEYERYYYWRVKARIDRYESQFSEIFEYYVAAPVPQIQEINFTENLCAGELLYLEVTANSGDWNYQWHKNGTPISGATESHYTVDPSTLDETGIYYCMVWNKIETDTVTTENMQVTVYDRPFIVEEPQSLKKKIGGKAIFTMKVDALGFAPDNLPKVEWFRGGTKIIDDNNRYMVFYEAANDVFKMMINEIGEEDYSDKYFARVIDRCDSIAHVSNYFALEEQKSEPPYITVNPDDANVCEGAAVLLQVDVEGGGSGETPVYSYQWYRKGDNQALEDNHFYSGTKTNELTITALQKTYVDDYYAEIHVMPYDTTLISEAAEVSIKAIPKIVNQSTDTVGVDIDRTLVLYVVAEGDDLQYQWYFDHSMIAGADEPEYVVDHYNETNAGTYYCEVWNECHKTSSYSIEVVAVEDHILESLISVTPNPVSDKAKVNLKLPAQGQVKLMLVDSQGRPISEISEGFTPSGESSFDFSVDSLGLSSGKYFILLQYNGNSVTVPIIIVN